MVIFNSYVKLPEGTWHFPFSSILHILFHIFSNHIYLVGGIPTPLKNMKVSWDHYSQLNGKNKKVPNHQPDIIYIYYTIYPIIYPIIYPTISQYGNHQPDMFIASVTSFSKATPGCCHDPISSWGTYSRTNKVRSSATTLRSSWGYHGELTINWDKGW